MYRLLLGFLFLVCVAPLLGQKYTYKKFTTYDGLPVNNVYCCVQDGDGFMWFGTDFGIVKFDGKIFEHYYINNGMVNKAVPCMSYAGGDSILFLSHPNVLQSLHTKTGKIVTVKNQFPSTTTLQFFNGELHFWKRFSSTFQKYKNGENTEYRIDEVFDKKDLKYSTRLTLENNKTIFCTNHGIYIKSPEGYQQYFNELNITYGIQTKNKNFVFATNKGVFFANEHFEQLGSFIPLPNDASIYYIAEDGDGAIWLRGLNKYIFRLYNNKLTDESAFLGLQNKEVNSMFLDKEDNFWFCTTNDGILLMPKFYKNYTDANGLVNNNIQTLFLQKNKLWIGTENGMSIFENNQLVSFRLANNSKSQDYIYKITALNKDTIGVALSSSHLLGQQKIFQKINQTNTNFFTSLNLWKQNENTFWVDEGEAITIHRSNMPNEKVYSANYKIKKSYCFYQYDNAIWIGTDTGILIYDLNKKFTLRDSILSFKIGEVFDFLEDKNHTLWIATDVGVFTYKNNVFTVQTKGNTFNSNYCKKLALDDDGNIWVATWDGLVNIQGKHRKVISAGLTSKVINDIVYNPETKEFYVGTNNGLCIVPKSATRQDIELPPVFIKAVYLNQEQEFPFSAGETLAPESNNVVFYLSTPYYKNVDDLSFDYKLDNNDWVNITGNKVVLSKQNKGEHKLIVRTNVSGDYSKEYTFAFTIKTPFYQTNWFIALMVILLQALVIYAIYRYNKKDKEKKIASLRQLNEQASLKQQAFTSLLNPHFIFNSLNSIQNFINKQDRTNANRYLSDFATLIRRNFDAAQKQFIPLENEIENLRLYLQLEHMRFGDKVAYSIILDDNVDADNWMLPTLILQPFVENALLHGIMPLKENGSIEIKFSVEKQKTIDKVVATENLIISISDNGIGMIKSVNLNSNKKHKSRGMYLIKERLEILSKVTNTNITLSVQNLTETNNEQPGTIVKIVYPEQVYDTYRKINQSYHENET